MLVDDHHVVREGYRSLLAKHPDLSVIAEAGNGEQAYLNFKKYHPDLVIMDITLPDHSGLEAISRIKHNCKTAKILAFSMHLNPRYAVLALRHGALGYVTKSSEPEILLQAIHQVYSGHRILSSDIAQSVALEKTGLEEKKLESLSAREFEIFRMLAEAQSKDRIAQKLHISTKTVSNIHYLIKTKLAVSSDIELTHFAIRMKVIDIAELTGPDLL